MFLGDLAARTERKARKARKDQKLKKDDDNDSSPREALASASSATSTTPTSNSIPTQQRPLIYSTDNPSIPREMMIEYLRTCTQLMLDESTPAIVVARQAQSGAPLHAINIVMQTELMENQFQIEKSFGCRYMSELPTLYPDDTELIEAGKRFTYSTLKCFTEAMKYRAQKLNQKLKKSGGLTKPQILEFFEGCNATMGLEETKAALKAEYERTKQPPNQMVIDFQHRVLELLGVDHTYGVSCLNRIPTDFPNDYDLAIKMSQFALCAQLACREATLSDEAKAEFYSGIPPFMHHFPHIYIHRQRSMVEQQKQQELQGSHNALSEMQKYFSSPEGSIKMKELSTRVESSRLRVEGEIEAWDAERSEAFFESFPTHPALSQISEAGSDPKIRLLRFLDLSESDLDDLMRMQILLAKDIQSGGTLVKKIASTDAGRGLMGNMHALRSMAGVGSLGAGGANMSKLSGHGHGNISGHECDSCNQPMRNPTPDVSTGKGATMDR